MIAIEKKATSIKNNQRQTIFRGFRVSNWTQRKLSQPEIGQETERLVAVCANEGVEAVVSELESSRELLESLAKACFRCGLSSAGQYLTYLETPYPLD